MEISILILLLVFFSLLLLNVPISFCIGLATLATMLISIDFMPAVTTMAQRMAGGINSFALLAIPFFILSGLIMGRGGIAKRLIECAMALIGMLPGGLALVNVVSCMFFGAISGSAVAATSAIGSFMLPEMKKQGYDVNFSAAVTASAATTGMLIPPSNILIVYAIASGGVSIAALFVAGYLPGILLGVSLMLVCAGYAKLKGYPVGARLPLKLVAQKVAAALPSLFMIFLVIGGIIGGIFTATEAGAIAVIYSLILAVGLYREVKVSELSGILMKAAETTAIVMFLVAAAGVSAWLITTASIPQQVADLVRPFMDNKMLLMFILMLMVFIIGTALDFTPTVLIMTPVLMPVVKEAGIDPVYFGVLFIINNAIGLVTPPVGTVLNVVCSIAKIPMSGAIKGVMPFMIAQTTVMLLLIIFPQIVMWPLHMMTR